MKYSAESNNFREELNNKISKQPGFQILTPKVFNDKPFIGEVKGLNFKLSLNSHFKSLNSIKISGKYYSKSKNLYFVEYEVDLPKNDKIISITFGIIFFVTINFALYKEDIETRIFTNFFILIMVLISIFTTILLKRKVKNTFEKEFNLRINNYS